jgi:aspartate aminotransferase-like enzyme
LCLRLFNTGKTAADLQRAHKKAGTSVVARTHRELQKATWIQLPAGLPAQHPVHVTRKSDARTRRTEDMMSCPRMFVWDFMMSESVRRHKLMVPGPVDVDRAVLAEMGAPVAVHYGPEWAAFY